ncbi:MAG TPA: peptidase M30, partial [Spirochaetota bacterium]|nr:peptidase M30 [Spirochaetota bacterium]
MTKDMVDIFSDKFLSQTGENIYKWITNIYGEEWGEHSNSDLIPDDDNITIFLCDIDEDNKRDGGVLGFFYAKDNFYRTKYDFSNQRIMFYIDAVLFAEKEELLWDISDKWPMQCISTLAHEFQHMIHFYQKSVLKTNKNSETFLNEMCSLIAEDFVADKLQTDGPRGVAYDIGGAGSPGNKNGRLPLFNYYNGSSLTNWGNGTTKTEELMKSYAICYSFAAYIARNFGGALLFRNIVQNDKYDYRAIDDALKISGFSDETFFTLIQKWGVAVLLSDI